MDRTGQTIGEGGRYELLQELGRGAMGQVYLAQDTRLQRRVVVKILADEYARHDGVRRRFVNEALIQANILHTNIVRALDAVEEEALLAIVMDYVDGPDLGTYLQQRGGRLTWAAAVALLDPVLDAVATAHAAGVVHRDLKPANVLVQAGPGGPVPRVADFGIAKILGDDAGAGKTRAGAVLGTPHYMPPEQLRGLTDLDARADVYALGAILYQMVTGSLPHGDKTTEYEVTHAVLSGNVPPPASSQNPALPAGVDGVIAHAMAPDREARFQSVTELRAAVQAVGSSRAVAPPATILEEPAPVAPAITLDASPPGPPAPARKPPVVPIALGVLILALIGGLAAAVSLVGDTEATPNVAVPEPAATAVASAPPVMPVPAAPTCPPKLPDGNEAGQWAANVWQPGNVWIYKTTRSSTKAVVDEAAALDYNLRWEIESVSPHPSGKLVRLRQRGGVVAEPYVTWLVSDRCVSDPETLEQRFCLGSGSGSISVDVAGATVGGYRGQSETLKVSAHPGVGVLQESGAGNRKSTLRTRRLVAFKVGDCEVGDTARVPATCDWTSKSSRGSKGAEPPGGTFGAQVARHLGGRLKRFSLGVGGAQGLRQVEAFTDSSSTVVRLEGLSGAAAKGFVLDGELQAVKLRRRADGGADHVALVTTSDSEANLHLFDVQHGALASAHRIKSAGSHRRSTIRGYVTAEGDDCAYLLAIRDPSGATRIARYLLDGSSLTPAGGSLPASVSPMGGLR